jgi:hypothetical protein
MGVDTDFVLDKDGHITRKDPNDGSEKNLYDRLYASDDKGNATDKHIQIDKKEVNDATIISNMSKKNEYTERGGYYGGNLKTNITTSNSKIDTFKFFKFVADNSNVEWSVAKFSNGKQNFYMIGTYHRENVSPGYIFEGVNNAYIWKGSVHSHPVPKRLTDSGFYSDNSNAVYHQKKYGLNYPFMVYHPNVLNRPTINIQSFIDEFGEDVVKPPKIVPTYKF